MHVLIQTHWSRHCWWLQAYCPGWHPAPVRIGNQMPEDNWSTGNNVHVVELLTSLTLAAYQQKLSHQPSVSCFLRETASRRKNPECNSYPGANTAMWEDSSVEALSVFEKKVTEAHKVGEDTKQRRWANATCLHQLSPAVCLTAAAR